MCIIIAITLRKPYEKCTKTLKINKIINNNFLFVIWCYPLSKFYFSTYVSIENSRWEVKKRKNLTFCVIQVKLTWQVCRHSIPMSFHQVPNLMWKDDPSKKSFLHTQRKHKVWTNSNISTWIVFWLDAIRQLLIWT